MMGLAMSRAGAALLRALIARAQEEADRVLLVDIRSTDWHSLTFAGERHSITLRVAGPEGARVLARVTDGLEDHEFTLAGQIVADITVIDTVSTMADGSATTTIEALTVAE